MVQFEKRNGVPQCTLENYEKDFADRHLVHGVLTKWAREKPKAPAMINADDLDHVSWEQFDRISTALALKLLEMGYEKGDVFATSLPLLTEHIYLEYACFKIGVHFVPLDIRLKGPEVIRSVDLVKAKGYAFPGLTPQADFRGLGKAVMANCLSVEHFIQISPPDEVLDGAISAFLLMVQAQELGLEILERPADSVWMSKYWERIWSIDENDGCLIIFTTGSTGYPKPALLSHRNITCQNMCLGTAFGIDSEARMLVNLPPSHVGCQTEQLMTTFFHGGTAVLLHVFDAEKSLMAIQEHGVNCFGQIPALFNMEWRLPNYKDYRLSSLKFALYGGQQVSRAFLEKLSTMAPGFGTGLGLTETAGFCTYSPLDGTVDDILAGVGYDMPVYPISIHREMNSDGTAGARLPDGEIGHICFNGPQTFLGYVNSPEATASTISSDGYLYTGDMGFVDGKGLHLSGRAKLVIKPKGYQVFPAQIEEHFCALTAKVANCAVVGMPHEIYSEAVVAFIEEKPAVSLDYEELEEHARGLAGYMRPLHYVILKSGALPLNRVAKTDYVILKEMAREEVAKLREGGGWDT